MRCTKGYIKGQAPIKDGSTPMWSENKHSITKYSMNSTIIALDKLGAYSWSQWSNNHHEGKICTLIPKGHHPKMMQIDCSHIPISPTNTKALPNNNNGSPLISFWPWIAIGNIIFQMGLDGTSTLCPQS